MHIHNNSILHYLYNMAVGLVVHSKARAFKAKTKAKSSSPRPRNVAQGQGLTSLLLDNSPLDICPLACSVRVRVRVKSRVSRVSRVRVSIRVRVRFMVWVGNDRHSDRWRDVCICGR